MYWQGAAALLLGASTYIPQVAAQVITITQYPSTCSAIYTSGSKSVTVAQSTVTVQPVPWNDNLANGGTAFVLQALPAVTGITKRQAPAPRWVLRNGYLTTDGKQAARYTIMRDQLTEASGGWISTFEGIPYGTFVVSQTVGNLNTTFSIRDGKLVWSNAKFTDGVAKLCQTPDGAQDPPHIVARFYGADDNACTPYNLYARPVNAATEGTSPPPGMSSTNIVSSIGGGMSSMQPPVSLSGYQTPSYTYQPTNGGQGGQSSAASSAGDAASSQGSQPSGYPAQSSEGGNTPSSQGGQHSGYPAESSGGNAPSSQPGQPSASPPAYSGGNVPSSQGGQLSGYPASSAPTSQAGQSTVASGQGNQPSGSTAQSSSAAASPTPTGPVSPDGFCGGETEFVCAPPQCCGQYGYCGNAVAYCGDGCQPGFGLCWSSTSTLAAATSIGPPVSYPPDISRPSSSASTSYSVPSVAPSPTTSYQPAPTYASCPDDDMETITDGYGMQYMIGCGQDTTIGMSASDTVNRGFNECFELCDERPDCTAFTYLGGVDGVGPGICYYKNTPVNFVAVNNDDRYVGGIRVNKPSGYASSAAASSTSTGPTYSTYTATATPIAPDNPGGYQSQTSSSSAANSRSAISVADTSTLSPGGMTTPSSSSSPAVPPPPYQTPASSTSSSPPLAAYSLCPAADGKAYSDPDGTEYTIMCGRDFAPGSFKILPFDSLSACINACIGQTEQTCVGVTFGGGQCYFKASFSASTSSSGLDSAVLVMMPPAEYSSASSSTLMASSSSAMAAMSSSSSMMGAMSRSSSAMAAMSSSSSVMAAMSSSSSPSTSLIASTSTRPGPSTTSTSTSLPAVAYSSTSQVGSTTSMSTSVPVSASTSTNQGSSTTSTSSAATPSTTRLVTPNGHCGTQGNGGTPEGYTCRNSLFGDCCSLSGFCGYSSEYCLAGCQPGFGECTAQGANPITESGECGPDWNNHTCTGGIFGPCCSTSGFCGSDEDYCGPGNCINGFGTCDPDPSTTMPKSTTRTTTTTTSPTTSSRPLITTTTTSTTRTTTTTTTSSSSTAYLVLPTPTPCDFGDPVGYDEDDSYCKITLPFPLRIYTQSDANTFASTNGYLSITVGSSQYTSQQFPASNLPNNTVAPFFDDLFLDGGESPRQGIFYQFQGGAVTYEWCVSRAGSPDRIYHWTVRYDSAVPGVFTYTYYSTGGPTDQGETASIGAQGKDANGAAIGSTYAYHVQTIAPGLVVRCDTNTNTCITVT